MKRMHCGLLIVGVLLLPSCAAKQPAGPPPAGTIQENTVTATARVTKIDKAKRIVTLVGADGQPFNVTCGPEVRNFDQIKVGDDVSVTYFESLAYEVRKPGEGTPGVAVAEGVERAQPGERPAAAGVRVTTVTATITGIDKSKGTVTLTGPDGDVVTVKARNPANLDKVKTGDLVDISMTQAVAIAVEPTKK